ncbi:hypothetical protein L596_019822 [Steinernema carpocapsae]|uniref:Uncharacterized protein n=1 Tax=Steinernema carpocapsae TaxID=34508 RepID=A0A4U5MS99_STECR|nr:hypothetical protein L596_019822 [Steinernema carpocapsae]
MIDVSPETLFTSRNWAVFFSKLGFSSACGNASHGFSWYMFWFLRQPNAFENSGICIIVAIVRIEDLGWGSFL